MKKENIGVIIGIIIIIIAGLILILHNKNTNEQKETEKSVIGDGKVLVVYYSATNNTERVANLIARNLNADIFVIEPVDPYTSSDLNWNDQNSRVYKEHNDESLRNVELVRLEVPDWNSYKTVLIGYPIWWGTAAWPVDTFIKNNDFKNKTIIPFCTSASTDISESEKNLKELAPNGNWIEGHRFKSSATEDEINEWVNTLK